MGILEKVHNIHLIGIGGVGMSAMAEILLNLKFSVSGSDKKESFITQRLSGLGMKIFNNHNPENIKGAELIIFSSSIPPDNPEISAAKTKEIPVVHRAHILKELMADKKGVAISGAHGKTTVTSLVSLILIESGFDPTVLIGSDVHFLGSNARFGRGEFFVTEADESDGTNLVLNPYYCIATNVDKEHMDYFHTMKNVVSSYRKFLNNVSEQGCAFVCTDDKSLKDLIRDFSRPVTSYGLNSSADISAKNLRLFPNGEGSEFDCIYKKDLLGKRVRLRIPGVHNIVNSLAAIALGLKLGVSFEKLHDVIGEFRGAERRFKITRTHHDILVIDDYAHHPTEISATLSSFVKTRPLRLICAFQPHRYTRTRYLKAEFGRCFNLVDHLVITDIYSADEEPIKGVSGRDIYESVRSNGHRDVVFLPKERIVEHLADLARPGDVIFILGAGDIGELPQKLISRLNQIQGSTLVRHEKD